MQYYTFQHIFDKFSEQKEATKAEDHNVGKVRDKFTEIIDIIGIDIDLLRKHKDEKSGKMVNFGKSNRQFCFPETICDFCVELLMRYTDKDFKKLRKGQFKKVAIDELDFLMNGFTRYLTDLGYDTCTITKEKSNMDERLHYSLSIRMFQLYQECDGLLKDATKYNDSTLESIYEDNVYFTWYMVEKVKKLRDYIASVYGNFTDLRYIDADNFAKEESLNTYTVETIKDIQQTLLIGDALEHDRDYQALLKRQMEILCTKDFIKNLKTSYKKNIDQLNCIKEQHERELFGDIVQETEQICIFTPRHPLDVLHDAIKWTDETEQEQVDDKEREANTTQEQQEIKKDEWSKLYSKYFDLPVIEHEEQSIRKKGIIRYPCCAEEKTVVYEGASGCVLNRCPRCSKQVLFNLSDMTSELYTTPRGQMEPL